MTDFSSSFCGICEGYGDLVVCDGGCLGSFHEKCLKEDMKINIGADDVFVCSPCKTNSHSCLLCNEVTLTVKHKSGTTVQQAKKCGKRSCDGYYHMACLLNKELTTPIVSSYKPNFNKLGHVMACLLHHCGSCETRGDKARPLLPCLRCPRAFHRSCIPPVSFAYEDEGRCLCCLHDPLPTTAMNPDDGHADVVPLVQETEPFSMYNGKWTMPKEAALFRVPQALVEETKEIRDPSKPAKYRKITRNIYSCARPVVKKKKKNRDDEGDDELCECSVGCLDTCYNRAMNMECPKECAAEGCTNQRLRNRVYGGKGKVLKTPGRGFGFKITEPVTAGTLITEYCGDVIDEAECRARSEQYRKDCVKNYYMFKVSNSFIIDAGPAGNYARFINHSCDPNCVSQKWIVSGLTRVGIYALRDLPADTELTYNYNFDLDWIGDDSAEQPCLCGSSNCSGIFGRMLTKEQLNERDQAELEAKQPKKRKRAQKRNISKVESPSQNERAPKMVESPSSSAQKETEASPFLTPPATSSNEAGTTYV